MKTTSLREKGYIVIYFMEKGRVNPIFSIYFIKKTPYNPVAIVLTPLYIMKVEKGDGLYDE